MKSKSIKIIALSFLMLLSLLPSKVPSSPVLAEEEKDITPYVQYNFNNQLVDSQGHSLLTAWTSTSSDGRSNSSTNYGIDDNGSYWQWHSSTPRGGGFYIDIDKNIGEEYTIGLKFSFEQTAPSWKKIIDYKNSTVDTGFYFYNGGHLNFYNYGVNGASVTANNQVVDLIVRRNKNGQFEAYVVNNLVKKLDMSVTDASGQGIPTVINGKTRLGFFFDDIATSSEASSGGKVYQVKVWDWYVDPDDVIEALKPKGDVIAHYVDEEGDLVLEDKKYTGTVDKPYSIEHEEVYGYEYLKSLGDPTTGVFLDGEVLNVTFLYKCLIPYTVTARYTDESGQKLCEDILYKGEEGTPYQLNQLEIDGYDFVRVEGEETGVYVKKPRLVTYIYKKTEKPAILEEGTVNVTYVDEEGHKLAEDMIYKGHVEEVYQTTPLTIRGYTLKQVVGQETGKFTEAPIVVKYVYIEKTNEEKEEEIEKGTGGSVLVRYQDEQGYTISSDVIYNGKIDDTYIAERKHISKFKLSQVIGEETGKIGQNVKVVTMIYSALASDVLARYVDDQGLTIANTKVYSGSFGESYQTEKLKINGYQLVEIDGQESGTFGEHVQVVRYVYRRLGDVRVKYQNLNGETIKEDTLQTGFVGDDYKTTAPYIPGHELVRVDGDEIGQYQIDEQVVCYVYERIIEGKVIVHYVDEDGQKLTGDEIIHGRAGKPYEVEVKDIHGCRYLRSTGMLKGELVEGTTDVTLIYHVEIPKTVTARYVDENQNLLCQDIVYKGYVNEVYKTSQLELTGYEFVEVLGNPAGTFKDLPQLVTYVYKKQEVVQEEGKVLAFYVDDEGNTLHTNLTYRGWVGYDYKTSALIFPGYQLKEIVGEEKGQYKTSMQTVTYIYEEKESSDPIGGTVIVKYQTEEGITIRNDDIFNGWIGDPYKAIRYAISGYHFERSEGAFYDTVLSRFRLTRTLNSEEGEIEELVKEIIMIYEPEEKASTVIARYVDTLGNTLEFDQVYNGLIGENYKTEKQEIKGYQLLRIDGIEEGLFENQVQMVTYVYEVKEEPKQVDIVIIIVDEDGHIIKEEIITGKEGDPYHLDLIPKEMEGYEFIRIDGPVDGYFGEDDGKIMFVYRKIENKDDINHPEDISPIETSDMNELSLYSYSALAILSLAMMIYLKKRA